MITPNHTRHNMLGPNARRVEVRLNTDLAGAGKAIDTDWNHGNVKLFASKMRGEVSLQYRLRMCNIEWAATYTNTLGRLFGRRTTETLW